MKLQLINDVNTLKSTDNATAIELAIVDEQQQFIDLSQFTNIEVKIGANGTLYLTEIPELKLEENTFSFTLSHSLPVGKYQIQVHLFNEDGKLHIAPNKGAQALTIEKSFNQISDVTIAVMAVQQLLDDMAATTISAEEAKANSADAVDKVNQILNIATDLENTTNNIAQIADNAQNVSNTTAALAQNSNDIANNANTTAAAAEATANNALTIANNAETVANAANTNANDARDIANNALSIVTSANNNADNAVTVANDAQNVANTALDNSEDAITTANTALNTANTADTNASTALTNSNNAVTTANEAKNIADSTHTISTDAQTTATNAVTTANTAVTIAQNVRNDFDTLINLSGNTDAELIAARTDEENIQYETLKKRMDAEANKRTAGDTQTLTNANAYTDAAKNETVEEIKAYTDSAKVDAVKDAKSYTDTTNEQTLSDAKSYADDVANTALTDANTYSDTANAQTLATANTYTDSANAQTLKDAKSYTDQEIQNIGVSNFATKADLSTKVEKIEGKGLSTNDYTTDEKEKLQNIEDEANKTIVENSVSSTSEVNAASANAVKIVNDKTENHLSDLMPHESELNQYASSVDENGVYTVVTYKRNDGTTYMTSTASDKDENDNYTKFTWRFYDENNVLVLVKVWQIIYDENNVAMMKEVQ